MLHITLPISILLLALVALGLYFLLQPNKKVATPGSIPVLQKGKIVLSGGTINGHSLKEYDHSVFLFPGNHIYHHKKSAITLTCSEGGGLAAAATQLSQNKELVLSLATQNGHQTNHHFDQHLQEDSVVRSAFSRSLLACWYLLGKGKTLVIPVRHRSKKSLFAAPIEPTTEFEPSWWGGGQP